MSPRSMTGATRVAQLDIALYAMAITAGAQSETNAKQLTQPAALAGEWSELGNRDIDDRARGATVRAREAIELSLSEFRCDPILTTNH